MSSKIRNMQKRVQESVDKAEGYLNTPVTISECVQISRGVAEDVLKDYHGDQANVQLAMSIQLELLKELVISNGLVTAEAFKEMYMNKAQELQMMQAQMKRAQQRENVSASMKVEAGDIEIKKEEE